MRKPDLSLKETKSLFEGIQKLEGQQVPKNLIACLLVFSVSLAVNYLLTNWIFLIVRTMLEKAGLELEDSNIRLLFSLYGTIITIIVTLIFTGLVEKRPSYTLLLRKQKLLPDYFGGLLLGFGLMSAIVLTAWKGGALRYEGMAMPENKAMMTALIVGWLIQGFAEELLFRGYLMMSVGTHYPPWAAVIISAVMFMLLHTPNRGFNAMAALNLILFGTAMSLYMLRTGSIWGAAALHSAWNWAQGNFFGLQVSGKQTALTFMQFSQTGDAELLGGKAFGLEAGFETTVLMLGMMIVLLLLPQRKARI